MVTGQSDATSRGPVVLKSVFLDFFGVFHYCSVDKEAVRNLQLPYFELETTALRSCQIENSQMSS